MIRLIRDQVLNKSKEIFSINLMYRSALFIKYDLKGIMNGGYDAVLRRYFGVGIEYSVRQYLEKFQIDVGQAIAVKTGHPKVEWLIVSPTVSVTGEGLSGHASVSYACAYNSVKVAHQRGAKYLGMTGLGSGVGGLNRREAARQQVQGIEDALSEIS